MFKLIAAIFLLFAFTTQTFQQAVTVMNYYINTGSFSKNCMNKARPVLKCNGKCQMAKKIREEEKKSENNGELKGANKNENLYAVSYFTKAAFKITEHLHAFSGDYTVSLPEERCTHIFHPPVVPVA
jgi:hypothetical protein